MNVMTKISKPSAKLLWDHHPYPKSPCNTELFPNQCAIRMTEALIGAGVDISSFDKLYPRRRCSSAYPSLKHHHPGHIMSAQELANWMDKNPALFGPTKKFRGDITSANFVGKKGIVFIMNGWGSTDHIDIWNGNKMKGGQPQYFGLGEEIWFWQLD
ncbi:MAG: T6SS effector amidase Tae4 family protein [Cellvibrio sp.]